MLLLMSGFRRMEVNHVNFFDMFALRNISRWSCRKKFLELLAKKRIEPLAQKGTSSNYLEYLSVRQSLVRWKFDVELNN